MVNTENQFDKYYVVDTNIILQDAHSLMTLSDNSQNLVIIPETVLDELDAKKSGFDEINYQARQFGRLLSDAEVLSMNSVSGDYKIIELKINHGHNVRVDIISKEMYKVESQKTAGNILNDRKIIEIAAFAQDHYLTDDEERVSGKLEFLSLDIMARTRALSMKIPTNTLKGSGDKDFDYSFHKTIEYGEEVAPEFFENKDIKDFDEEYKPYNFSYSLRLPSGREILVAIHSGGRIALLDEDEIRRQAVSPKNKEQLFFSSAITDDNYQVLAVDAKAGSGKTLLALSGAMKMVKKKQYSKIVYIRNSIESLDKGEDVGFLSGNEEKFKIYNHPLMDSIEYIVRSEMKKSINNKAGGKESDIHQIAVQEKVEETIDRYGIETMWVGELRGRTITDAVVIVDEAQNMSNKTMQMVLTRIDASCKVIVLGSNKQIDNFYINQHTNGLSTLLNSTQAEYEGINIFSIQLHKVLRGPITEWAENIFSGEFAK
jgi:PhoH-like ATPase